MKLGLLSSAAAAATLVLSAAAASAGGFTTVPEPVVVEPVTPAPVAAGNWQGAYGGVSLGYAFGGDDDFGLDANDGSDVETLGNLELGGVNGGLHLGYRWQRDRWVVGPELSITGGKIEDDFTTAGGVDIESKVNHVAALKLKTGYEVQPNMLVYGTAGVARGDFTYTVDGEDFDYNANGFVFGLGVERMMSDRMSVFGEIERNQFDKEEVEVAPGLVSNASPSFNNVKVGVNFKF